MRGRSGDSQRPREGGRKEGGEGEGDGMSGTISYTNKHAQTGLGEDKAAQLTSKSPSLESIDSRPGRAQSSLTPRMKPVVR